MVVKTTMERTTQEYGRDILTMIAEARAQGVPPELEAKLKLMEQAADGDNAALSALMLEVADEAPSPKVAGGTSLTLAEAADPVEIARTAVLEAVYGNVPYRQELGRRQLLAVESDLAGPNPSPTEKMLAQQAALCWMQLAHYEKQNARLLSASPQDAADLRLEEFYQKRVFLFQRRFESAVKCLAQVRKLALPTMQVNLAKHQVNVGAGQVKVKKGQVNVLAETVGIEES